MTEIRKTQWITAIATFALGMTLIIWPSISAQLLCFAIGAVIFILGIVNIIQYVKGKQQGVLRRVCLWIGILLSVLGIWLCFFPQAILTIIPIILSVIIFLHGIADIQYTFSLKNMGVERWQISLLASLLSIVLAVFIFVNAFETMEFFMTIIGCILVYDGLKDIIMAFMLGKTTKKYQKGIKDLETIDVDIIKEEVYPDK